MLRRAKRFGNGWAIALAAFFSNLMREICGVKKPQDGMRPKLLTVTAPSQVVSRQF